MSPRVQKVCSFLGKLLCYKTQSSKEILPANIEVKEIQSDDSQSSNHDKGEQRPKPSKANKEFNKEDLCCCWKDAARILDKTFFVFYSSSVFILTVIFIRSYADPRLSSQTVYSNSTSAINFLYCHDLIARLTKKTSQKRQLVFSFIFECNTSGFKSNGRLSHAVSK